LENIINNIIHDSIKEINEDLELEELENISDDTKIFELIDSLGTLDLVIELENRLQSQFGKYIQVANESTMDSEKTDFKTVATLREYLLKKSKDV
jgi:acyl carrier protein